MSGVDMLAWVVVVGLGAYRIARAVVLDSILDGVRARWSRWLVDEEVEVADYPGAPEVVVPTERFPGAAWLEELTACTWCIGFWLSGALWAAVAWEEWQAIGWWPWLAGWWAAAGIQGVMHTWER